MNKKLHHVNLGLKSNYKKREGGQDQNFTKQVKISSQSLANLHMRKKKRSSIFCRCYLSFTLRERLRTHKVFIKDKIVPVLFP